MMVYIVILGRKEKKEVVFKTVSPQVKLPPQEVYQKYQDTFLTIITCDAATLDDEDAQLLNGELAKQMKAA